VFITEHLTRTRDKYNPDAIEQAAEADAAGFEWPAAAMHQDADEVRTEGSLRGAIEAKIEAHRSQRFNAERVDALFSADPEYDTLRDIAVHGARIEVPPDVILDREPPPFREKQLRMPLTVQKHACKLWQKGRGIVLRADDIPVEERPDIAYHSSHWTSKTDDDPQKAAAGRWLLDCATVNTDATRDAAIKRYGKVELPTLASILAGWLAYATKLNVPMAECEIAKDDVSSAYPQFDFSPASTMLMAVCIATGLIFMYLTGMFGWTGCPMVFACISRAMLRRIRIRSDSPTDLYVDDFIMFTIKGRGKAQQKMVEEVIDSTFPGGVDTQKRRTPGPAQEILGWDVDLQTGLVNPNVKGREKLLLYFFTFNTSVSHSIQEWEQLASLAERYSHGICGMRGMVAPLHAAVAECHARGTRSTGSSSSQWCQARPEQMACIEMWRVVATMMMLHPTCLAVPITWVARHEPAFPPGLRKGLHLKLVSDASPWKLCAVLQDINNTTIAWTTLTLPFDSAAFQNIREYLGLLLGLLLINAAAKQGIISVGTDPTIIWEGDNTSALSWAESGKVKSRGGQMANLAVIWSQLYGNFNVDSAVHLAGIHMGDVDGASRDKELTDLSQQTFVPMENSPGIRELFSLCNPLIHSEILEFHEAFQQLHTCLREVFS
jgi:hypothetical protein